MLDEYNCYHRLFKNDDTLQRGSADGTLSRSTSTSEFMPDATLRQARTHSGIDQAVAELQRGNPVLIHDAADREGETDLIYPAHSVQTRAVAHLRNDAGGLICVALSSEVADIFEIPFLADEIEHDAVTDHELSYDERSSFSLPVNHCETYTGITDKDRAKTIRELGNGAQNPEKVDFSTEFRVPGHVPLLRGAPNLLADRCGHTELSLALAKTAELPPAMVVCEMLDDATGEALPAHEAHAYAVENDLVFLEGSKIVDELR